MRQQDWVRLIVLAAIWGASFLFFRMLAPTLGVFFTVDSRVLIAGIALTAWLLASGGATYWKTHPLQLTLIGLTNSAIPFSLFAFAALHLPVAYSAILNAFTPIFAFIFGVLWLGERLSCVRVLGLILGVAGVAMVANPWQRAAGFAPNEYFLLAVGACLLCTLLYAASGVYIKKRAANIPANAIAAGSQLSAGVALLPLALANPPAASAFTPTLIAALLAMALLCSAVAYSLYFRLMKDVGPSRAQLVTLLVPLFGMLWGTLFLGESLSLSAIAGCALILLGTFAATRQRA